MTAIGFLRDLVAGAKRDSRSQNGSDEPDGKQRLSALKRILLQATRVVLLDEPFSALDVTGCREMLGFIRALAQQGRAVIVCSSSLIYAKDVCDRLAVLYRGELQAIGTVQELLARRESLRFIVDLLPGETAEHLSQLVRLELGISDPPKRSSFESPVASQPGRDAADLPSTPHRPAAPSERILARLVKVDAPADRPIDQPSSTVNHEMLAALTKHAEGDSRPRLETKSESPPASDPCRTAKR
jgi:ABC-type multidrug transport system ATPase subunit